MNPSYSVPTEQVISEITVQLHTAALHRIDFLVQAGLEAVLSRGSFKLSPELRQTIKAIRQGAQATAAMSVRGREDAATCTCLQGSSLEMIDTKKAADILGVDPKTVRRWALELGVQKVNGRWALNSAIVALMAGEKKNHGQDNEQGSGDRAAR